ncbi:hypothetical protein COOONC_06285 [Cooperia oncophora]
MTTEVKAEVGNSAIGRPPTSDAGTDVYRGRSPGPYVPGTSWRTWWKLFSNFLVLRKVTEEREQRLVFLQEVGNSNYELLESLLQGRELEEVELKELRQAMERHYQPKKLVLAERFGLMSKVQKPGQALHEYYAELQKAANTCSFEEIKNHRDAVVTMVFIGGLLSVDTRKRLLEKEDLTSKEALEQAEAFERVGVNAPHLKEGPQAVGIAEVRMRNRQPARRTQTVDQKGKSSKGPARRDLRCRVCGALGHAGYECFRKQSAYCKVCKKKGHLPTTCWKSARVGRKVSRQVHWCEEPAGSSDSGEEMVRQGVNTVVVSRIPHCRRAEFRRPARLSRAKYCQRREDGSFLEDNGTYQRVAASTSGSSRERSAASSIMVNRNEEGHDKEGSDNSAVNVDGGVDRSPVEPPVMLEMKVNGKKIPFELDTGASLSIIDERTWYSLGRPQLSKAEVAATAFDNNRIKFQGKVPIHVEFAGNEATVDVHVLRRRVTPYVEET